MKKNIKYKGIKIILEYCNYNFEWYAIKKYGSIILFININLSKEVKSKILHKAISNSIN